MRIIPSLLGWDDPGAGFTGAIQIGTFISTLIYFRFEIIELLISWIRNIVSLGKYQDDYVRIAWSVIVGTIPIVVVGLMYKDVIEHQLRSLYIVSYSMVGLALIMYLAERLVYARRDLRKIRVWDGFIIGIWQVLALIPGASRSGSTIVGALFQELNRASAARYSFLLSLPSVLGAGIFCVKNHSAELLGDALGPLLLGMGVSCVVGYYMLKTFIRYLGKNTLWVFIVYRLALGIFIFSMLKLGFLTEF